MRLLALFFLLFVTACVTDGDRKHDCFEFGAWQCVGYYEKLSPTDRVTPTAVNLRKQICEQSDIKCVEEPGDHGFPLNLKMAKEGYANLSQQVGKGKVTGVYQKADKDPRHQESVDALLLLDQKISQCRDNVLSSCETLITKGNFGLGFDSFFRPVPKDIIDAASSLICKNSNYRCLSFDQVKPYSAPKGWDIIENSTSINFKENVKSEKRHVILRKTVKNL